MSSVPSLLSGQLGAFLRRTRENALELDIVGGTRLENQIQSAFGGVQVENLPTHIQQIIAQDRALGGGGNSGPLTLINPFTNDSLSLDEQKAAANQMAFQQGANPPFPEVQQQQSQDGVLGAARRASAGLQAGVDDDTITKQTQQHFVKQAITSHKLDNKRLAKATEDARAVLTQQGNGRMTQQAAAAAMEKMRGEFGEILLNNIDEWQELTGTREEFEARIGERIEAEAKKWPNLPPESFRHDRETDTIVTNEQWDENKARSLSIAEEEAKPLLEERKAARRSADSLFELDKRQIEVRRQFEFKIDSPTAAKNYNRDLRAITASHDRELARIHALGRDAAAQPTAPPEQPQAPAAIPGLPAGVKLSGTFANADEVVAASARIPTQSYITIGAVLFRRKLDGNYEPAAQ